MFSPTFRNSSNSPKKHHLGDLSLSSETLPKSTLRKRFEHTFDSASDKPSNQITLRASALTIHPDITPRTLILSLSNFTFRFNAFRATIFALSDKAATTVQ